MSKLVRILAIVEAGVLGFFAYFVFELSVNDQFFVAWLNSQLLGPLSLPLFYVAIGALASNAVFYAVRPATVTNVVTGGVGLPTVAGPPLDLPTEMAKVKDLNKRASAPPTPPSETETKIVVPPKSGLATYIRQKSRQYQLVNQDGSAVQKVPVPRDRKAGNESD